jgi:cyclic pyranopterin phosphate synthase
MIDDVSLPKVEIHVTEACNNRCAFCTTGWVNAERSERLEHVPRERIRMQLEEAFAKGARRALFQGGEPTLRSDLGALLKDARAIGYEATTIFTNARMASSRAGARALADMRATWFQVSIQGGTAEAHDASVCAPGAFEQTIRGTRRLLELGQRVKINTVLTVHAIASLQELAALLAELRPEEVGFDTVKPSAAFGESRARYSELVPHLTSSIGPIRDAVQTLHRAHVVVRLTSFPACVAPDLAPFVSEETGTTQSGQTTGLVVLKRAWKWGNQVKAEGCAACAYDDVCGGLQAPYAALYGTSELRALDARVEGAPTEGRGYAVSLVETDTTRALRRLFAHASSAAFAVQEVTRAQGDMHVLRAVGPLGETVIELHPRDEESAFATTRRFSIRYVNNMNSDARILRAVHRALARWEARIDEDEEG